MAGQSPVGTSFRVYDRVVMPANLPPEYKEAEGRFRSAVTPEEKLAALEALEEPDVVGIHV